MSTMTEAAPSGAGINRNQLFLLSCLSLIVTAMTFAIRAGILTQLSEEFQLSDTELGWVNSMAFLGFPLAMVVFGFLYPLGPSALVGGGGQGLKTPAAKGYGGGDGPPSLWLPNGGMVVWTDTDLALPGVGLPLTFERVWRGSVTGYDGPLGLEWEVNWNKRLFEEGDDDVVFYEMGRAETYDESSGSYTSPAGRYDTLAKDTTPDPDVFTRTDKWGVVETYEDEGGGEGDQTGYDLSVLRMMSDGTPALHSTAHDGKKHAQNGDFLNFQQDPPPDIQTFLQTNKVS